MPDDKRRIEEVVRLLRSWKDRRSQPEVYEQAQALADKLLDRPPAVLELLLTMLDAGVASTTIGQDLVSFVAESDLPIVAREAFLAQKRDNDSGGENLLDHVALQRPDLAPDWAAEMHDFRLWRKEQACWAPLHLIFEQGAQALPFGKRWATRDRHPTWELPAHPAAFRFGGPGSSLCPSCGQNAIHLLTLDSELAEFPQTKERIVLETCPTCWGVAYYRHGANGHPHRIEPIIPEGFRWENVPMIEQSVRFAATPERWKFQSWGHSNSRQNLSRLGGAPAWIQNAETPLAPGTTRKMKLLLQLDSEFPTVDGNALLWGSGGILYVFWDSETRTSCHFAQWT
jgi:hypothetical protein